MEKFKPNILLVEDDENLGLLLQEYLNSKGYNASLYINGESALNAFKNSSFDLCIIDIMLPAMDGFTLAREIKVINSNVPIIFLSAKTLKQDVIEGFKIGADDYITKPFSMEELTYRIDAILKRVKTIPEPQNIIKLGKFTFNVQKQELTDDTKTIKLTTRETELLELLYQHKDSYLDRSYALKRIWREENYYNARSMDVYITRLRKILSSDPNLEIKNVHSKGFKLIINE
ncbi:MAG: response regulator transcription factor [Bacteroidales bacterium]|nr:response regulator transcription factor [Bacteroidales bacterium]